MLSASEMQKIADEFNNEQHQKQLPDLEDAAVSAAFATEKKIRQRAANGEYSTITPDLLYELKMALGPRMPASVKGINELVTALSDKLREYFSGQGFLVYAVAPLDCTGYYLKIKWGGDEQ